MRHPMKTFLAVALAFPAALRAEPPRVTADEHNVLHVNGRKILPIAVWLQPEETFAMWKEMGVNWFIASSHPNRGGTLAAYLKAAEEHDVYVSIGIQWARREGMLEEVARHPRVLTLHHNDEPDKPKTRSDAVVEKGATLRVNSARPLFTMLDGNLRTSAVIDPPRDSDFTIRPPRAVTARRLAVAVEVGNYAVPRQLEFLADGQPLLKVELEKKTGLQTFDLPAATEFRALTVRVLSAHEGGGGFAAVAEVQALDADGKNALLVEAIDTATETPDEILADYRAVRAIDPQRLVSLCLMARFMPEVRFKKIPMEMYRQYPPATDLLMFDLYPASVYKGRNLHWNAEGLKQLRALAGPRKVLGIWLQASDAMNKDDPGMSPEQIRADAWLSLIHGATFIGWFPQTFNPRFKFHDINETRRAAVRGVNREITELADLVLAPPREDLFAVRADGGRVDAMQREAGGRALLVLVNVIEDGPGAPMRVTIAPNAFRPAAALARRGTNAPLEQKDGAWTLELKPWETAVIVADRRP